MSSVDDPEKHFLGNLLEDDPGPSLVPSAFSRSAESPPVAPLANVGPVMGPVADSCMSNAWPEPPPPYSPPLESWSVPSNINTTLTGSSSTTAGGWYPFTDRKEPSTMDVLNNFNSSVPPPQTSRVPPQSPQVHHFHHNLHHHTHTHNVQVQNHYFGAPPPGLEAFGPRSTTTTTSSSSSSSTSSAPPKSVPLFDSLTSTSPVWSYTGIANINTNSNSVLFSDWKKENMGQTSPEPSPTPQAGATLEMPRSPARVVEMAKEKKSLSKSYAEHLSKASTVTPKKGTPIGAEKKQKQELAKRLSNQQPLLAEATHILVKGQPHSAPVVTKMPFSYRDVAARVEHTPGGHLMHAAAHLERKEASSSETKGDAKSASSKDGSFLSDSSKTDGESSKSSERKSRADNEFQKISSRKNKKEKHPNTQSVAPIVLESVHPVDSSSRYEVLQNLENVPERNVKKVNGRPPMIQEIFSRSSSPVDDMEDTEGEETHRTRSASNHTHLNGVNGSKKESKKRAVQQQQQQQQSNQRRRKFRKTEPTWFDNALLVSLDFVLLVWSYIVHGFQWTFELIVDVCVKIYDVFLTSTEFVYMGALRGVRKLLLTILWSLCCILIGLKHGACLVGSFTLCNLLGLVDEDDIAEEETKSVDWGCRKEVPIATSATEFTDRLSRETVRDAYTVFGLRNDCSDDIIKRNYKRLAALVSPDKCGIEAVDEVFLLVNAAFDAIGNQESRAKYTPENAKRNDQHQKVLKLWKEMSVRVEEARNTIFCDCTKRHYRIPTGIAPSQARFCKRCAVKHPAKQNDIWVEKRNLGFSSVYLTCTDNVVYDITEWATCESQRAMLKNMRAHTHHVQYRLLSPMSADYDTAPTSSQYFNYPTNPTDARFLSDLQEEYSSLLRQRSLAQISFKTCEPREEDRSRRAANRRQKRWR